MSGWQARRGTPSQAFDLLPLNQSGRVPRFPLGSQHLLKLSKFCSKPLEPLGVEVKLRYPNVSSWLLRKSAPSPSVAQSSTWLLRSSEARLDMARWVVRVMVAGVGLVLKAFTLSLPHRLWTGGAWVSCSSSCLQGSHPSHWRERGTLRLRCLGKWYRSWRVAEG